MLVWLFSRHSFHRDWKVRFTPSDLAKYPLALSSPSGSIVGSEFRTLDISIASGSDTVSVPPQTGHNGSSGSESLLPPRRGGLRGGAKLIDCRPLRMPEGIVTRYVIPGWAGGDQHEFITSLPECNDELTVRDAEYQWIPNIDIIVQSSFKIYYPSPERWEEGLVAVPRTEAGHPRTILINPLTGEYEIIECMSRDRYWHEWIEHRLETQIQSHAEWTYTRPNTIRSPIDPRCGRISRGN